ncbi:N-acetylmuramoyl-L-alanine amidase [Bacillus oleivorans]|uniref:N-acetylmuramoyl-L-alanine amidase n=1 Tax=Bacillus oleivorans TaxID=1448271 RepID=A0A285CVQ7_9BACI|nr:SH3 domain-containing protein [Bacillus oleivorans]SNX71669.1 N-acetylmuramoyl-L-alanine amidase [Bacillus oleivorans]
MSKKGITILFTCFLIIPILFPALPAYSNEEEVTVNVDHLNVRKGPGLTYDIIGSVKRGDHFKVTDRENDWIKISIGGSEDGWVASWYVNEQKPEISETAQAIVTVDRLRIRKGPGLHFGILGFVNQDQYVNVLDSVEDWIHISTKSTNGWVSKEYLQFVDSTNPVTDNKASSSKKGTVTVNRLNVRDQPSLSSSVIGKLNEGEEIHIQQVESDWVKIQYKGTKAWVSAQYVSIKEPSEEEKTSESNKTKTDTDEESNEETASPTEDTISDLQAIVTASSLNVRDDGSLSGRIVDSISKGDQVTILEEKSKWIKIKYDGNKTGWVAGWYLEKLAVSVPDSKSEEKETDKEIIILYNGTNIRLGPDTTYPVVQRAKQGETFKILQKTGDWYEIEISSSKPAYVAGWVVTTNSTDSSIERANESQYLAGKTIVIDAGHGGADRGTSGATGTNEKEITIRTSQLLAQKLKSAGANVIMTRSDDRYLSLRSRVSLSHYYDADVFISLHYDSFEDPSVHGITSYYYNSDNKALAEMIQSELASKTKLNNRGARYGNYFVLRENNRPSVLVELGYLSNPIEEATVQTSPYQEQVTTGIYYGLAKYFKSISP